MKKITILVFLLLCIATCIYFSRSRKTNLPSTSQVASNQEQETAKAEAINGVLADEAVSGSRPLAVMVENHPDARPQSGLADADIVYEALAEGGITRFMAVYQSKESKNIGPVRSARDYYAVLANEIGALYAHVGGSNEVIGQLKNGVYKNLSDANEYYNEKFFGRVSYRSAPHNVYTSTEKLNSLASFHKYSTAASFEPWLFKSDAPATAAEAGNIHIDFSLPSFAVDYKYDSAKNVYERSEAKQSQLDAQTKQQLAAKVVIVQKVKVEPVPKDPLLSINITLTGQGIGYVFQDGRVLSVAWKKEGNGRTRYYDQAGSEIKFNRGQIWVELVPDDGAERVVWQ